jgi:hypothetical protein
MTTGIPDEMTRAEYARYRGCRRSYITQLAYQGRLVLTGDGRLVKVHESDRRIEDSRDPSKEGVRERWAADRATAHATQLALEAAGDETPAPSAQVGASAVQTPSLMDVRRELITEQAAASKLKRLELEGRLIDRETVRRTVFEKTRVARNAILGLSERLPPLLAAESSEVKIRDMLLVEFRRICDELADGEEQPTRQ